jgi:copper resistance protein D
LTDPLVYVRAVHFAATILAAGTVFFQVLVAEPAFAAAGGDLFPAMQRLRCRWSWLVWISLAVAVLSAAVWLVLLAAAIYGAPIAEVWRNGGVWTVAIATRFGQVWSARLGLAVLLALSLPPRPRWSFVPLILAAGLLIAPAWTGHAGATPGAAGQFHLVADVLHLLAAGAWIGSLPPLAMLLAAARRTKEPGWKNIVSGAIRRFSLLGMASVGVLLATGIVNTWYEVGSFANLVATAYGRLIVLKVGLFAAMVAIAAVNRFHLTPRLAAVGAVRQLQRNSLAEAALGFAAVLVVGFLGTMAPASHAHQHPASAAIPADAAFTHIHLLEGMADVTIMPGRTGTARATIRLWDEDFGPLEAQEVTLTLTAPTAASKPTTHFALQGPDGAWQVEGIELSQSGNWTVTVGAVLGPHKRLVLTAPMVIEPGP